MGQTKPFTAVLPYENRFLIIKTQCCIIVVSIARLRVVLQMSLQTISSRVLSSDGHLKPACVSSLGKLARNYENCDHNSN